MFLIARSAFGEFFTRRAGPSAAKLAEGFRADAFHYLLFLRLVPVFPFWLVNLAAALFSVRLKTFVAATAIGIVPATLRVCAHRRRARQRHRGAGAQYNACVAAGRADCRVNFDLSHVVHAARSCWRWRRSARWR